MRSFKMLGALHSSLPPTLTTSRRAQTGLPLTVAFVGRGLAVFRSSVQGINDLEPITEKVQGDRLKTIKKSESNKENRR